MFLTTLQVPYIELFIINPTKNTTLTHSCHSEPVFSDLMREVLAIWQYLGFIGLKVVN